MIIIIDTVGDINFVGPRQMICSRQMSENKSVLMIQTEHHAGFAPSIELMSGPPKEVVQVKEILSDWIKMKWFQAKGTNLFHGIPVIDLREILEDIRSQNSSS